MIAYYLKIFVKLLIKNRLINLLNALGLLIGILSALLIFYYVLFEKSYDQFHAHKNQIWRVITENYKDNQLTRTSSVTPTPMGPTIVEEISGISAYTRFAFAGHAEVNHLGQSIFEEDISFVDPAFFDFFSFPLKAGSDCSELANPNNIFLSESFARKIFGNIDPMGKAISIVSFNTKHVCTVKGIFCDLPENTYFKLNAAISFPNFYHKWGSQMDQDWVFHILSTFIKLKPNAKHWDIEKQLETISEKYMGSFFKERNIYRKYKLQPISNMYLHSGLLYEFGKNGDGKSVRILSTIAWLILAISLFNSLNLLSSIAIIRSNEIAIRKTFGGGRKNIISQLFFENLLLILIVGFVSCDLFLLSKNQLQLLVSKQMDTMQPLWWIFFLVAVFFVVISSTYQILLATSVKTTEVLRGRNKIAVTKFLQFFKKTLLVLQFVASFCFIVFSLVINKQIKYMANKNLGININNTLIINKPYLPENADSAILGNYCSFIQQLEQYEQINNIAESGHIPGKDIVLRQRFRKKGEPLEMERYCNVTFVDANYLVNYNHKLIAGKNFPDKDYENRNLAIINQQARKLLGFESCNHAIGQTILMASLEFEIVGIIENYHQQSLQNNFMPIVMKLGESPTGYISLKLNHGNNAHLLASVKNTWEKCFPHSPIQYFYLKDFFQKQYSPELLLNKIIAMLTAISVLIAILGVSGLSYFDLTNRTKEIGIRKILGANILKLTLAFSKSYLIIVLLALFVGFPLAYKTVNNWLEKFAFTMAFPWFQFLLSALLLLVVVLLTVSCFILYIANSNPEKAIRQG